MALGRWPGLSVDRTGCIALLGATLSVLAGAAGPKGVRAAIDVPTLVILFGLMVLSVPSGFAPALAGDGQIEDVMRYSQDIPDDDHPFVQS